MADNRNGRFPEYVFGRRAVPFGRNILKCADPSAPKATKDGPKANANVVLGMTLAPLDDEVRKRFAIASSVTKGVVVTQLTPNSSAGKKGIKPGDVIVEAAQRPVSKIEDVANAVAGIRGAGRRAVLLRIESPKGQMRFVAVPIE